MTDISGLGSLFEEEGPGRTGAPTLLPQYGLFGETRQSLEDRLRGRITNTTDTFGGFQRDDGRSVQFGLPTEFTQAELLEAVQGIQQAPMRSSLEDRKAVADVAKRLEAMPEDDPMFAESPLDMLSADIDDTLSQIEAAKSKTASQKASDAAIDKKMNRDAVAPLIVPQEKVEEAAMAAFNDYLEAARGAGPDTPKVKDLDDYKKQFAEATGIDISGNVDKSHALMTFGLALMQNKAGKGFNVAKMLSSVGTAGEAALPALEKAKAQARNDAIAAGKFALEARAADETKAAAAREKALTRSGYFVVPKSKDVKGFLAGVSEGRGRLEQLSKYEVDKLLNNPEFAAKYDILPGSTWSSVVEEAMKTPEAKDLYRDSPTTVSLIKGIDDDLFNIRVYDPDPNTNRGGQPIMAGDGQQQYEALARMARDNEKAKQKFIDLGILNKGTSAFRYSANALDGIAEAFGINFVEGANATQKMKKILTQLQAKNAPSILGEAGKTISDADRQMVKDIVGDVTIMSSPDLLAEKFEDLFNDIIMGTEADIRGALSTLNRYTGRSIGASVGTGKLSEEEQQELNDALQKMGLS